MSNLIFLLPAVFTFFAGWLGGEWCEEKRGRREWREDHPDPAEHYAGELAKAEGKNA